MLLQGSVRDQVGRQVGWVNPVESMSMGEPGNSTSGILAWCLLFSLFSPGLAYPAPPCKVELCWGIVVEGSVEDPGKHRVGCNYMVTVLAGVFVGGGLTVLDWRDHTRNTPKRGRRRHSRGPWRGWPSGRGS